MVMIYDEAPKPSPAAARNRRLGVATHCTHTMLGFHPGRVLFERDAVRSTQVRIIPPPICVALPRLISAQLPDAVLTLASPAGEFVGG